MSSINLFPIKIYKTHYDDCQWVKDNLFPKLEYTWKPSEENNQIFMRNGTICTYYEESHINRQFPEETKKIVEFVEHHAREYWKELDYFPGLEPYVLEMWANKTPKGGWVHSHAHLSLPLTATLYIDASPEQGNIIFENPLDTLLASQPVNYQNGKYQFEHEFETNTGDLVIFPGYIKHKVKSNTIDRERLILGFTFGARGLYWAQNWVTEPIGHVEDLMGKLYEEREKNKGY